LELITKLSSPVATNNPKAKNTTRQQLKPMRDFLTLLEPTYLTDAPTNVTGECIDLWLSYVL
jgi:hypothetical protein